MSTQPVASQFRVVRPSAGIVSQHRTLSGAQRSLERQQRGAAAQGGYSQDYIEQRDDKGQYRAVAAEQDEE